MKIDNTIKKNQKETKKLDNGKLSIEDLDKQIEKILLPLASTNFKITSDIKNDKVLFFIENVNTLTLKRIVIIAFNPCEENICYKNENTNHVHTKISDESLKQSIVLESELAKIYNELYSKREVFLKICLKRLECMLAEN